MNAAPSSSHHPHDEIEIVPTESPRVATGLTSERARTLFAEIGPNVLAEPPGPSHVRRFCSNLVHLFALLLWLGAVLAFVGGLPELAAAIVAVILVNAVFAFVQEHRAERASEALRHVLPQTARVRTEQRSVFSIGLLSNRFLLVGIAFELALAVALVYVPGLNGAFHQAPIPVWWWLPLLVWAPIVFFAEETRKALLRRHLPVEKPHAVR